MRTKNMLRAIGYSMLGFIVSFAGLLGMVYMYLSNTFLPVYIKGTYVIGNRILRYELYAILFVISMASLKLSLDGIEYLIKKFQRNKRRR